MANAEHVEILMQGVEVWNKWREENPGRHIYLGWSDLSGMDLERVDLHSCNCPRTNFSGANLSWANLEKVHIGRSDLSGASLHGARLTEANFYESDLSGADLSATRLWETRFEAANLTNVDLSDSILLRTELSRANLGGANLRGSRLLRVDFQGASLRGVDLSGSWLEEIWLEGADLFGADFSGASMRGVTWRSFDLRTVRGLDSVVHIGPCTLGVETLFFSQGQIPERFLRGCGLAQEYIAALATVPAPQVAYESCMLYFRAEDKSFALRLHALLEEHGVCCWLSEDDDPLESDYPGDYDAPVNKVWNKVLFCSSRTAQKSPTGFLAEKLVQEKEIALEKTQGTAQQLLFLLDLDGFLFEPGTSEWQESCWAALRPRVVADFVGWETEQEKMSQGLESVLKALRTDGGREEPPKSLL